jgi:hypothetical protein
MKLSSMVLSTVLAGSVGALQATPVVFSAAGADAASIQATVDAFRVSLGTLNPSVPGSLGSGRREINWDGVPDALSAPNAFPGNFFNANVAGRARGVEFTTPGVGFQVSANAGSGTAAEFGNINASYPGIFTTFSAQRLFTAIGSNIVDVNFFVPGSATAALTRGFGVVFTDVDLANTTSIQYFDSSNNLLGQFFAASFAGDETLSFLGVNFTDGNVIARARITSGSTALAPGNTSGDLVVMDDFIYGEPTLSAQQIPEPAAAWLVLLGLAALAGTRQHSRRVGRQVSSH